MNNYLRLLSSFLAEYIHLSVTTLALKLFLFHVDISFLTKLWGRGKHVLEVSCKTKKGNTAILVMFVYEHLLM